MEEADMISINVFDIVVVLVVLGSAVLAWLRGLISEVLTIFAWVGALAITLWNFPYVSRALEGSVHSPLVRGGLAAMGTYLVALIGISIINAIIIKYVKTGDEVGAVDKGAGFVFGVFRGMFIVCMGFLIMAFFIPVDKKDESLMDSDDNVPTWLEESKLRPMVLEGAAVLAQGLPDYIDLSGVSKAFKRKDGEGSSSSSSSKPVRKLGGIFREPDTEEEEDDGYDNSETSRTVRPGRIDMKELDAFFGGGDDKKEETKKEKEKSFLW